MKKKIRHRSLAAVTTALALFLGVASQQAKAGAVTYAATWSGAPQGNTASATGLITLDTATLPNPGSYGNSSALPSFLLDLTITVSGAGAGDGTFTMSDFQGMYWDTGGGTLDLTTQLVGQPIGGGNTWGFTIGKFGTGDFNFFTSAPAAPRGILPFLLSTGNNTNDIMQLTSLAPAAAPEPGSFALILIGALTMAGFAGRRIQLNRR